jgi:MoaA/NifB/PqqE/SkfB family radical SAM enzyme
VTGGEPFLREDLEDIINVLRKKTNRLVISSNGFFTERILSLFKKRKDIGIRISIEGLPKANDELRGIKDGFDRGIRTLIELHHMGVKDIGFGITISDRNAKDMIELYHLSKMMGLEFATAAIHNSFYFHKFDNNFQNPEVAIEELKKLIDELLKSRKIKDWFRAYFNYGLINYIKGSPRLLPCEMGHDSFFLDPTGEIFPCNVMEESMGNLKEKPFDEIWNSDKAKEIREKVKSCPNNCWMIGSVSQQMKKNIMVPLKWIIKHKFLKRPVCC